jgi:predicted nucleotidyltransferase
MKPEQELQKLGEEHDVLAIYLFGSRAADGQRRLSGEPVEASGSDLDIGVVFRRMPDPLALGELQAKLQDLFTPLRVDLVPLQRVDALFQFAAVSGERIAATDSTRADEYELEVMRQASELLPIQRRIEIDLFGATDR